VTDLAVVLNDSRDFLRIRGIFARRSAAIESAGIMAIAENTLITTVFFMLLSNKKCQLEKNKYCYDASVRRLI
jgi:hypothetical protein